jgi:hypothetical protein
MTGQGLTGHQQGYDNMSGQPMGGTGVTGTHGTHGTLPPQQPASGGITVSPIYFTFGRCDPIHLTHTGNATWSSSSPTTTAIPHGGYGPS